MKILYEDEEIIAVDKPAGIASISESETSLETIHSILEKKYARKIYVVHRLDKDVSGVILFAKSAAAHKHYNKLFRERSIGKKYIALVNGVIENETGRIDKPIREFGSGRMGVDEIKGKPSVTEFKVIKRFTGFTLLEINLITGRKHQIRVHLYSIGHSVAGDLKYGNSEMQKKIPRLMLHAFQIELPSANDVGKKITAEIPDSFSEFLTAIK